MTDVIEYTKDLIAQIEARTKGDKYCVFGDCMFKNCPNVNKQLEDLKNSISEYESKHKHSKGVKS
jgi:hypothetical protein